MATLIVAIVMLMMLTMVVVTLILMVYFTYKYNQTALKKGNIFAMLCIVS